MGNGNTKTSILYEISNTKTTKIDKNTIVLLGAMGNGKSTTGNNLLGGNMFTSGNDSVSVTKSISLMTSGDLTVVDCPGFGDPSNETIFFRSFLNKKEQLLNAAPIDAFVLVTKFDRDESGAFLQTAEHFVKSFGKPALKSLIILCIQGSPARRYSDSEFDEILKQTSGYTYLKSSNSDNEIKYLLWENIYAPYPNQRQNFDSVRKSLPKYSKEQMEMAFDLVENRAEFMENK
jgi:predicted GTPase